MCAAISLAFVLFFFSGAHLYVVLRAWLLPVAYTGASVLPGRQFFRLLFESC